MENKLTMDSVILFKGKKLTMDKFMQRIGANTIEEAQASFDILERKGFVSLESEDMTEEQEILEQAIKEDKISNIVEGLEEEEYQAKQRQRKEALEDTESLNIQLPFKNSLEREEFIIWLESFGIDDIETSERKGEILLKVYEITPQEYSKIANKYQRDNTINNAVEGTKKAVTNVAEGINYATNKIVAPTAKIVGEAGMRVGKGVATTLAKTGAGLFSSGAEAVKDTAQALRTDREMLQARKEAREMVDGIKSLFRKRKNKKLKKSGITTF